VTLNFNPVSGSPVAWYVGGNLSISGNATLNFNTPAIIYVNGTVNISNTTTITGHGTIIAQNINLSGPLNGSGTDPKVALIALNSDTTTFSNPVNIPAVVYAPNGAVKFSSGGTIKGSIVAKKGVTFDSGIDLTFDSSMTSGGGSSWLPGPASVTFKKASSSLPLRRSWKELISSAYNVTPANMTGTFHSAPYGTSVIGGDFSS